VLCKTKANIHISKPFTNQQQQTHTKGQQLLRYPDYSSTLMQHVVTITTLFSSTPVSVLQVRWYICFVCTSCFSQTNWWSNFHMMLFAMWSANKTAISCRLHSAGPHKTGNQCELAHCKLKQTNINNKTHTTNTITTKTEHKSNSKQRQGPMHKPRSQDSAMCNHTAIA
jgi:hypothetical protein